MDGDIDLAHLCCGREGISQTEIAGKSWKRSCGDQQSQAMTDTETPRHRQGINCRCPSPWSAACKRQAPVAIGDVDGLAPRTNVAQAYKEIVVRTGGRGR